MFLYDKIIHGNRLLISDTVSTTTAIHSPRMYLLKKRVEKNEGVSIWQFLAPFKEESWVLLWATLVMVRTVTNLLQDFTVKSKKLENFYGVFGNQRTISNFEAITDCKIRIQDLLS